MTLKRFKEGSELGWICYSGPVHRKGFPEETRFFETEEEAKLHATTEMKDGIDFVVVAQIKWEGGEV